MEHSPVLLDHMLPPMPLSPQKLAGASDPLFSLIPMRWHSHGQTNPQVTPLRQLQLRITPAKPNALQGPAGHSLVGLQAR